MKDKTWVLQAQLISALRRMFIRSPMFQITRKAAQREKQVLNKDGTLSKQRRCEYRCQICGEYFDDKKIEVESFDKKGNKKTKKYHQIAVDHIDPFIPLSGMPLRDNGKIDWNILIDRMMLGVEIWNPKTDNYECIKDKARLICWKCHQTVSNQQNKTRRETKR